MVSSRAWGTLLIVVLAAACSSPSVPSPTPPAAMPTLSSPAQGALIGALEQPVTLTVQNPPASQGSSLKYTFEVATDAGFGMLVTSQAVAEEDGDHTSVTLGTLPPATIYYWRVRSTTSANTGLATTRAASFTVGPDVASGPYEMRIDTTSAECGGIFAEPAAIDLQLTRTSNGFSVVRNLHPACTIDIHCGDTFRFTATLTGNAFKAGVLENDVEMAIPAGYGIPGGYDFAVQGAVNADGTVAGLLLNAGPGARPTTLTLVTQTPTFSRESCTAPSFSWTLKPLT